MPRRSATWGICPMQISVPPWFPTLSVSRRNRYFTFGAVPRTRNDRNLYYYIIQRVFCQVFLPRASRQELKIFAKILPAFLVISAVCRHTAVETPRHIVAVDKRAPRHGAGLRFKNISGSSAPYGRSCNRRWSSRRRIRSRCRAPGKSGAVPRRTARRPRGGAGPAGYADC